MFQRQLSASSQLAAYLAPLPGQNLLAAGKTVPTIVTSTPVCPPHRLHKPRTGEGERGRMSGAGSLSLWELPWDPGWSLLATQRTSVTTLGQQQKEPKPVVISLQAWAVNSILLLPPSQSREVRGGDTQVPEETPPAGCKSEGGVKKEPISAPGWRRATSCTEGAAEQIMQRQL